MTDKQLERYARHIVLKDIGAVGQQKIMSAHILVVGAGGIGCPALQSLAAAGIGKITLFDDDIVSLSNLQRQILFTENDIGKFKVDVATQRLKQLNPDIEIVPIKKRLTAQHDRSILDDVDVVLDGCDNFATRLLINDLCIETKTPLVSAAIGQFQGQVGSFFGWQEAAPCYRCFVGDAFDAEDCDTCSDVGVLGAMCAMIANFAAMEVIRLITNFGESPMGKIHIIDGLKPAMRAMKLTKDPSCKSCSA
ncbi:molybdopterin biosynthesis protein MoeB [Sphingorhabdus lutea]|uniref:Molybdopterin biosynthesis protein MoeB n=1 Tax=Sphingorhabdus lutea TaxID=1913578 RepID=A0A1L3JEQ9_9SPHN|nr:molybdopterin biosynthesis protein MoeB [Sphingorhabdus lutea]